MRYLAATYIASLFFLTGWIAGTFGLSTSALVALVAGYLAFAAVRTTNPTRDTAKREYLYLGIASIVFFATLGVMIQKWFDRDYDRYPRQVREMQMLEAYLVSDPTYKQVSMEFHGRKGIWLELHGFVESQDHHKRLFEWAHENVRNFDNVYDDVLYPGKPEREK